MLSSRQITKYALGGLIEDAISASPDNKDRAKWRSRAALYAARQVKRHFATSGSKAQLARVIVDGIGDCDASTAMTDKLYAMFDFELRKSGAAE